jgi:hypothetical protein
MAQVVVGRGELRIDFDGLPVAGDGRVHLALVMQLNAQVVVGVGVLRVEFKGLAEAGDGLVVIPLPTSSVPPSNRGRRRASGSILVFREDAPYRTNVFPVPVPNLRG